MTLRRLTTTVLMGVRHRRTLLPSCYLLAAAGQLALVSTVKCKSVSRHSNCTCVLLPCVLDQQPLASGGW